MFPLCPRALANKGKIFLLAITKKAEPSLLLKSIGLAYEDAIIVANLFDADEQTLARFGVPPGASNTLIAMWAAELVVQQEKPRQALKLKETHHFTILGNDNRRFSLERKRY